MTLSKEHAGSHVRNAGYVGLAIIALTGDVLSGQRFPFWKKLLTRAEEGSRRNLGQLPSRFDLFKGRARRVGTGN
ncbi:MAG TPA: hypothetical protein VLF20_01850 [Patescibacteria group bacterium]|nr:hypothetical protein [Patescibacteria group bacterium]